MSGEALESIEIDGENWKEQNDRRNDAGEGEQEVHEIEDALESSFDYDGDVFDQEPMKLPQVGQTDCAGQSQPPVLYLHYLVIHK